MSQTSNRPMSPAPREQQRIDHLVLGLPRPTVKTYKAGKRKAAGRQPVQLAPGIEEAVKRREDWSHKQGTPETHAHVAGQYEGSLRRLYLSAAIDAHQLAAAAEITQTVEGIGAEVAVRTANYETSVDGGLQRDGGFYEGLDRVRREQAYSAWRVEVGTHAPALLALITEDLGVTLVARRFRMSVRRVRKLLTDALDRWIDLRRHTAKMIDRRVLDAAHAALLA